MMNYRSPLTRTTGTSTHPRPSLSIYAVSALKKAYLAGWYMSGTKADARRIVDEEFRDALIERLEFKVVYGKRATEHQ